MQPIEIVVIVISALFVVGVAVWALLRKRKGKSFCTGCDGDCANCKRHNSNKNANKDV